MDQSRKIVLALLVIAIVSAAAIAGLYALSMGKTVTKSGLPQGCEKSASGYLIIASDGGQYGIGFNGSEEHGAPNNPWPVINVTQGTEVVITVCNVDVQAHSFNVITYLGGSANAVSPGQVETFRFLADKAGTFEMYCDIFCSIHIYMQGGQLKVTA